MRDKVGWHGKCRGHNILVRIGTVALGDMYNPRRLDVRGGKTEQAVTNTHYSVGGE